MSHTIDSIELPVDGGWKAVQDVRFEHMWDAKEVRDQDITVDVLTTATFQTLAGLGGAFSEIGYRALQTLSDDARRDVLRQLFGREGAGMNFCRVPIGSSDFATDAYSHNDTPGDYEMEHFSIARDEQCLLKFILGAIEANPDLTCHASAWSPPGWMKVNGQMTGGSPLIDEPRVYQAYARYLRLFIRAYAERGVTIRRLLIQNEPECGKSYPTCCMPPAQMVELAAEYLAPEFQAAGLDTEIWGGTFTRLAGLYAFRCLSDPRFPRAVKGLGFQYELPEKIRDLSAAGGNLPVMHTESNCYMGLNQVVEGLTLYEDFWDYMTAGCDNFSYWNMVLNETHESGWGWRQNSLVVVDRTSGQVRYTPDFQVMKLLSSNLPPGAVRVGAHCLHLRKVLAFRRPRGGVTVFLYNPAKAKKATVTVDEAPAADVDLPEASLVAINL